MASNDSSPMKVESLEIQVIIHSLKISTKHKKYQVLVKTEKNITKETNKMKKSDTSDAVFFESTFNIKKRVSDQKDYGLKFIVLEYREGEAFVNGKARLDYNQIADKSIEFKDLSLQGCSDDSGIVCVSVFSERKFLPIVSFSEIVAKKELSNENCDGLIEDFENKDVSTKEEWMDTDESAKENLEIKTPPVVLSQSVPNSQSKANSLEQSEKRSEIGPGNDKCHCCCII